MIRKRWFLVALRIIGPAKCHGGQVRDDILLHPAVTFFAFQFGGFLAYAADPWLTNNGVGDINGRTRENLAVHFVLRTGTGSL
jgi:hypothetical protein